MIYAFRIDGLFGRTSVKIPFDSDTGIRILVGENGTGKTTILNILYNSLMFNYLKLSQYNFSSITISFGKNETACLTFDDVKKYVVFRTESGLHPEMITEIIKNCSDDDMNYLKSRLIKDTQQVDERVVFILRKSRFAKRYPINMLVQAISQYFNESLSNNLILFEKIVSEKIGQIKILYFPTYRRIEEDLSNLSIEIDDEEIDNIKNKADNLIQFGMEDVKNRIFSLKTEMEKLSSSGLTKISSEILSQLVKGVPEINTKQINKINIDNIKIILARVGNAMSEDDKSRILQIISDKELVKSEKYLLYFIQKLVEIYEQQKVIDDRIKAYVDICNKYLQSSQKNISYNENEVQLYIATPNSKEPYLLTDFLNKMSSGEKQVLSLFSKIYLSDNERFIILFDEPELSLSIFWQEILLTDILQSKKISNMLAVTHSPFIYEDKLKQYASGMGEYLDYGVKK